MAAPAKPTRDAGMQTLARVTDRPIREVETQTSLENDEEKGRVEKKGKGNPLDLPSPLRRRRGNKRE